MPGTTIMQDRRTMTIAKEGPQISDQEVHKAFNRLQHYQQAQFLALHEGSRPFKTRLLRIYKANAFGDSEGSHIYLNVSRINHACVPNAELALGPGVDDASVIGVRAIVEGEEVLINYNANFTAMTTRQRNKLLDAYYGFTCSCSTCLLDPVALALSDARRQLIKAISYPLQDFEPPDFSHLDDLTPESAETTPMYIGANLIQREVRLTQDRRCAYSFLLAKLYEAEGLMGAEVALAYFQAATALLRQMVAMKDIIVLSPAKILEQWAVKAVEIMTSVRGVHGAETVALREQWKEMQMQPQLYYALKHLGNIQLLHTNTGQLDGTNRNIFAYWHKQASNEMFGLTEDVCRRLLRGKISRSVFEHARKVKVSQ